MNESPIAHDPKVLDTIRKLLAKGNDKSVSETESMAFIAKAQEKMTAARITMEDLKETIVISEPVTQERWFPLYAGMAWRKALANNLATYCMCRLLYTKQFMPNSRGKYAMTPGFVIIGRPTSIAVFKEMMSYLCNTTMRLGLEYSKTTGDRSDRVPFENGCGLRLSSRVHQLYLDTTTTHDLVYGNNLPVLYKGDLEEADEFIAANIKVKAAKSLKINTNSLAAQVGYSKADGITLSKGDIKTKDNLAKPAEKIAGSPKRLTRG